MRSHNSLAIIEEVYHCSCRVVRATRHISGRVVQRVLVVGDASIWLEPSLSGDDADRADWVRKRTLLVGRDRVCSPFMPRRRTHALAATRPTSRHDCRRLRRVNDQLRRRHLAGGSSGEVAVFDLDSPALMVWEAILVLLNLTGILQLWVMLA